MLIAGIAILVLAGTSWLFYDRWQAAVEREATVRGQYAGFRDDIERKGNEARIAAEKKNVDNYAILTKQIRTVKALTNRAVYAERLLRERPPVRPDGSTVSSTTCDSGGTANAAGEFVSLVDYRALEVRAYRDTDKCNALQETVKDWAAKGLVTISVEVIK